MAGLQRVFSFRSLLPALVNALKLIVIIALSYGEVKRVLDDPIFFTAVGPARIAQFLIDSAGRILWRVGGVLVLVVGTFLYLLSTLGVGLFLSTVSQSQQQAFMEASGSS